MTDEADALFPEDVPRDPMLVPDAGIAYDEAVVAMPTPSPWRRAVRRLLRDKPAVVALAFLVLLLFVAIFAPLVAPHSPEEIRSLARRLGLSLDLYQPLRDIEGVDEDTFAGNLRRAGATFATAQRLGIDTILVCSNVATATIDSDEASAEQLHRERVRAGRVELGARAHGVPEVLERRHHAHGEHLMATSRGTRRSSAPRPRPTGTAPDTCNPPPCTRPPWRDTRRQCPTR